MSKRTAIFLVPLDQQGSGRAHLTQTVSEVSWEKLSGHSRVWKTWCLRCPLPCLSLLATVVHERSELFHRPMERYGHTGTFLLHSGYCIPVSGSCHLPNFRRFGTKDGEKKIWDISSPWLGLACHFPPLRGDHKTPLPLPRGDTTWPP